MRHHRAEDHRLHPHRRRPRVRRDPDAVEGRAADPWTGFDQVERAIFQWVTWYNEEGLHSALDYVPPAEYERGFWRSQEPAPQSA
ncbi:integrase core domain-containing protein [Streptomyces sp. NPDC020766]|uniref:integrase core domain-containing protein n=1 Tax=Streptomyces sp. NPDC020766 TaxID=3155011 RepID=UPI0033F3C162